NEVGRFEFAIITPDTAGDTDIATDCSGNGPADGLGGVAHEARIERAKIEACRVREGGLLAFETQFVGITVAAGWARGAAAIAAVESAQLTFIVTVGLYGTIQIQSEVVVLGRRKGQPTASAPVLRFNR